MHVEECIHSHALAGRGHAAAASLISAQAAARRWPGGGPRLVAAVARVRREPRTQRSDTVERLLPAVCVRFVGWLVGGKPARSRD